MKAKQLILAVVSILILVACAKENVDEIIIEDIVFQADSTIALGGFMRVWTEDEELFNEDGYAYECKGFHGDTTFYRICNDIYLSRLTTQFPSSDRRTIVAYMEWAKVGDSTFLMPNGYFGVQTHYPDAGTIRIPRAEKETTIEITSITNEFIEGKINGNLSAEFSLPLYQNCETSGLRVGSGNTAIWFPYVPGTNDVDARHISCKEGDVERHLVSTIPASISQYDQAPSTLLQNENDFYIYS